VQAAFRRVWDTVISVGWIENPAWLPYAADNDEIAIGRHAIAIDERRAFSARTFGAQPFRDAQRTSRFIQVWFPGVHADVGGGYPKRKSGLSKIALK